MAQPPSFYGGQVPQVGRLPQPIDTAAPLREGLDAAARTLGQAADEKRATDLQVRRIDRAREIQLKVGAAAAYIATEQGNLQTDVLHYREHSLPGADGHEAMVEARIAKFHEDVSTHLGNDPEVTSRFGDNVAEIAANARTGEVKWAMEQRAKKSVDDSDGLQNSLQSNIRAAVAAGTYNDQMLADADALDARAVHALPIGGNAQEQLIKVRHQERLVTRIDASIDVDPHGVLAQLDKGTFGELDDKVVNQLREHARVTADRIDNQIEQKANASSAMFRAEAGNLVEDVHGGTVTDDVKLRAFRDQFAASDKPEDIRLVHDLDAAIAQNKVNARYGNSAQDERLAAMREIEGHKGWQADNPLRVAHDQLQTLIGRDSHAAEADPVSLYAQQTGQAISPANVADPAAMRARFIVGDQAAQRFHKNVPMHFTETEAKALREDYNSATVGGKADFIMTLGAYGSSRAREMMFQIAPAKPELVRLAELAASREPGVQAIVREAADGSAVPVKEGTAGKVRSLMQREYGAALSRLPGDRQRAIETVATWVTAHRLAAGGKADQFDPAVAREGIQAALGGAGGKGGIGQRNGGAVVLPMGGTQQDFDTILSVPTPEQIHAAANGVPKWQGVNRALTLGEFRDLVPVQINDTGSQALYAFRSRGGSGFVKNERGQDYVLDVRRLADALRFDRSRRTAIRGGSMVARPTTPTGAH